MEYERGAYIINRKTRGKPSKAKRGAALFVVVLLLLSAAICLMVVFLPRFTEKASVGAAIGKPRTFYFLATTVTDAKDDAIQNAQVAMARGGAGYIYNDGKFRVVVAAYPRESDAKALTAVNEGSTYFSVDLGAGYSDENDIAAIDCLTNDFFDALYNAASELDRGTVTDAGADLIAREACKKLALAADAASDPALKASLEKAVDYSLPSDRTLLSYLRYVTVRALLIIKN